MAPSDVSVIIPTHGRPDFLREAIGSVLAQTSAPKEIVVVSDDREEQIRELVTRLAETSSVPITYIDNSAGPGGASSSRNKGAERSSGPLLAFLDDDDLWDPDYLRDAVRLLEAEEVDCVVTWLTMFRGDLHVPGLQMKRGLSAREVGSINPGFTGSNFVIRRPAFDRVAGFDDTLRVINDGDFVYRYLQSGGSYTVNERFQVLQRKHAAGQLTAATEMRARGLEQYMRKHAGTLTLRDRRYMRLAINRIRYHAAERRAQKLKFLLAGLVNSSPTSIAISIKGWKQRPIWRG